RTRGRGSAAGVGACLTTGFFRRFRRAGHRDESADVARSSQRPCLYQPHGRYSGPGPYAGTDPSRDPAPALGGRAFRTAAVRTGTLLLSRRYAAGSRTGRTTLKTDR